MHSLHSVRASFGAVPGGHEAHADFPSLAILPRSMHGVHSPPSLTAPATHATQLVRAAFGPVPAAHAEHKVPLPAIMRGASQLSHTPNVEKLPAAHSVQWAWSALGPLPAAHAVHAIEPFVGSAGSYCSPTVVAEHLVHESEYCE
jgi:hypothetical protein